MLPRSFTARARKGELRMRKFLLLFFQFPDAMLNFPVLCRNPLQKRRQLIIGFHLLRVLEV